MFLDSPEYSDKLDVNELNAKIELILDLNRRICLLDELMTAARAKRRLRHETDPVAMGASLA